MSSCWPFDRFSFWCSSAARCEPCGGACFTQHNRIPVTNGGPAILAAEFLASSDLLTNVPASCVGDIITLTFAAPVVGHPQPSDFAVSVSSWQEGSGWDGLWFEPLDVLDKCWRYQIDVQPDCVSLNPGHEPNDRNTVTLIGNFTGPYPNVREGSDAVDVAPNSVSIKSLSLLPEASGAPLNMSSRCRTNRCPHAKMCFG